MNVWPAAWFIGLAFLLLASNVYFRLKLIRIYKKLKEQNMRVGIGMLHSKLEREKLKRKYPGFENEIEEFARVVRVSSIVSISIVAILAISAFYFDLI